MKRSILFVDDEEKVLQGIRRSFYDLSDDWNLYFFDDGFKALNFIEDNFVDVIVTDMKMPGVDGATLLERSKELQPKSHRFVLSGHADLEEAVRALPIAHQYLLKPCDAEVLKEAIYRAFCLYEQLEHPGLSDLYGGPDGLPLAPALYREITRVVAQSDVSFDDLSKKIEADDKVTEAILKLTNSAYFVRRKKIGDIHRALSYLGMTIIKNLIIYLEIFRLYQTKDVFRILSSRQLQYQGYIAANIARGFFSDKKMSDDAFTAAMLHDIGRLIWAAINPSLVRSIMNESIERDVPMAEIEKERVGFTSSQVGSYLLYSWGMPYPVVEAVCYHQKPQMVLHSKFEILDAVYVASLFTKYPLQLKSGDYEGMGLDMGYLQQLGVAGELPRWRAMALEKLNVE